MEIKFDDTVLPTVVPNLGDSLPSTKLPALSPVPRSPRKTVRPFSFPWRKDSLEREWASEREARREATRALETAPVRFCDFYDQLQQRQQGCNLGRQEHRAIGLESQHHKGLSATQRSNEGRLTSPRKVGWPVLLPPVKRRQPAH